MYCTLCITGGTCRTTLFGVNVNDMTLFYSLSTTGAHWFGPHGLHVRPEAGAQVAVGVYGHVLPGICDAGIQKAHILVGDPPDPRLHYASFLARLVMEKVGKGPSWPSG